MTDQRRFVQFLSEYSFLLLILNSSKCSIHSSLSSLSPITINFPSPIFCYQIVILTCNFLPFVFFILFSSSSLILQMRLYLLLCLFLPFVLSQDLCADAPTEAAKIVCRQLNKWDANARVSLSFSSSFNHSY